MCCSNVKCKDCGKIFNPADGSHICAEFLQRDYEETQEYVYKRNQECCASLTSEMLKKFSGNSN